MRKVRFWIQVSLIPGLALLLSIGSVGTGCKSKPHAHPVETISENNFGLVNPGGTNITTRFNPPEGFNRVCYDSGSFAFFLQHVPLKENGSPVLLFNGQPKRSQHVHLAVIDFDCGNQDLQQCADAIIRLRAEFLYAAGYYDKIHFNFVSDGRPRYLLDYADTVDSIPYPVFRNYLNYIFSFANTRSLHDELIKVTNADSMRIGDVLIQTGNPYGHAVLVVDMATNPLTHDQVYMLAQSYMPAQDIHILRNPANPESPWYELDSDEVVTPEWTFNLSDLRRFAD